MSYKITLIVPHLGEYEDGPDYEDGEGLECYADELLWLARNQSGIGQMPQNGSPEALQDLHDWDASTYTIEKIEDV